MNPGAVEILDTTLRDGSKLPFVVLEPRDRLLIARQLAALGVDVIDAGYPAASREERESVELIAREVRGPVIAALCRATEDDAAGALAMLREAARPRLHLFLHTSPEFLKDVLRVSGDEALRLIVHCLKAVSAGKAELQFSLGEIGQAERSFLLEAVRAAAENGASVVNLADTNGCLHPQETAALVAAAVQALGDLPQVLLGVHLHNDLGLATAGTLAAVEAGARHVEVTVGGIGTRSGNAPLEEIVFALEVFRERLGLDHHVRLDQLEATSSLLKRLTGMSLHPNKPVLGKCAFQEGRAPEIRRALPQRLRELMRDESIGRAPDEMFADHEMSPAGFEQQVELLGVSLEAVNMDKLHGLFRAQLARKKTVLVSELREMVQEAQAEEQGAYELLSFSVATGSNAMPLGGVELRRGETVLLQSSHGSGPVDALCRAVDKAVGLKPRLLLYSVDSVTEGKDARATVTVSLAYLSRRFHGHSGSTDVVEASLRAYLDAVNSIERYRREAPEEEFYIEGDQLWWE